MDESQVAAVEPPASTRLVYDPVACKKWRDRVFGAGLEIEWQAKRRRYRNEHRGEADENTLSNEAKMTLLPKLLEMEEKIKREDRSPGKQRVKELQNLLVETPAEALADLETEQTWARNSLGVPVTSLSEPPSRAAVIILMTAEEDATFKRALLIPSTKKPGPAAKQPIDNGDSESETSEPETDPQTAKIIAKAAELEGNGLASDGAKKRRRKPKVSGSDSKAGGNGRSDSKPADRDLP